MRTVRVGVIVVMCAAAVLAAAVWPGKSRAREAAARREAIWPGPTGWGGVSKEMQAALVDPSAAYPPPVRSGGTLGEETKPYVIIMRIEQDLDRDGAPEVIVGTQNDTAEWKRHGPQGHVLIFDGKTGLLRYKDSVGLETHDIWVMDEGLPVKCVTGDEPMAPEPFVVVKGGSNKEAAEVIAWDGVSKQYERLFKAGDTLSQGSFIRWYPTLWGYPSASLRLYGLLYDESVPYAEVQGPGHGIVVVAYAWQPDRRRFELVSPAGEAGIAKSGDREERGGGRR
jgi:hypothetical protein